MEPAVVVVEAARLVDRGEHLKVVDARELEILAAGAGRDVHDPGSLVHRHVLPGNDAMFDL